MTKNNEFSNSVFNKIKRLISNNRKETKNLTQPLIPSVKIIECPRDAMQGVKSFISTRKKVTYINALLKVGYDTIDFGSFVSPQAIPQMRDTAKVLAKLDMLNTTSKLLAIVGNTRGSLEAATHEQITYIGFPHSVSETFLTRNLNSTIEKSKKTVAELIEICDKNRKQAVIYISMGFGNPYGDEWNVDYIAKCVEKLHTMGARIIPLSDTIGCSDVKSISNLFSHLIPAFPDVEFGFHLHTPTLHWYNKVNAAYKSGCRRFDTAINGLGGCPMASEGQLVGNLRTSNLLEYLEANNIPSNLNEEEFLKAYLVALKTFPASSFVK